MLHRPLALRISPEVCCLLLICILDTASSAILFQAGVAVEANPLLRPAAEAGVLAFVGAKSLTFVPCAVFMEWLRRSRPEFATTLLRLACAAYLGIYTLASAAQLLKG